MTNLWLGFIEVIILRPQTKVWTSVSNAHLCPCFLSAGCMERSVGVYWSGGRPHRHSGLLHGLQRQEHHPGVKGSAVAVQPQDHYQRLGFFDGTRSVIRLQCHNLPCVQHYLCILYPDCVCMPSVSINWLFGNVFFFGFFFPFHFHWGVCNYKVFETAKPGTRKLMKQVKYHFPVFFSFLFLKPCFN